MDSKILEINERFLPRVSKIKSKIFLEWSNINYIIQTKIKKRDKDKERDPESENLDKSLSSSNSSQDRILLNNIEGFAAPNELLAIMGPSGSGKTTFLNVLAMRQLSNDNHHVITRDVKYLK